MRIEATYLDPQTQDSLATRSARLAHFQFSPLDVLYFSTINETGTGSPLEAQMAYRLLRQRTSHVSPDALVRFSYEEEADWGEQEISFGTLLEQARAVRELITEARPLEARDVFLRESENPMPAIDGAELKRRADAAVRYLFAAHRYLEADTAGVAAGEIIELDRLRNAITRLFFLGMPTAVPVSASGDSEPAKIVLIEQTNNLLAEANQRLETLDKLAESLDRSSASPKIQIDLDTRRLKTVFGNDFQVLPYFRPHHPEAFRQSFAASLSLQGDDPLAAIAWLDQMAHVRVSCQRLYTSLTYAECLNPEFDSTLTVGQFPYEVGDLWVALPKTETAIIGSPRLSLVALMPEGIPENSVAGLFIDEWIEAIPNAQETAGIGFQFDAPQAQAPQAILLAVPPDQQPRWTLETLSAIVQETLDLAQLRTVDNVALYESNDAGFDLPALYLAMNLQGDTVSTDLATVATPISFD